MKTCKECDNYKICKEPCEWLESKLQGVEREKTELTLSDLKKKVDLQGDFN